MPSINRWKKYFQEAMGEDLLREGEPPLSITDVAKIRGTSLLDALTNLYLGPLFPLYVTSPSFKKEIDTATQILPNIEGLVLSPRNIEAIKNAVFSNMPKFVDADTLNAQIALAFIKAKYPKLSSLINRYRYRYLVDTYGRYDPNKEAIIVSVTEPNRPVEDFVGTIAHELVHALQNRRNKAFASKSSKYFQTMEKLKEELKKGNISYDEFIDAYYKVPEEAYAEAAAETAKKAFQKYLELIRANVKR